MPNLDSLEAWADPNNYAGLPTDQKAYVNRLLSNGVPPDVIQYMLRTPSWVEGQRPSGAGQLDWPYAYRGEEKEPRAAAPPNLVNPGSRRRAQDISYQPGGGQMPGMPWDSSSGGGQPQMSPQDIAWMRLMMQIRGSRGAGGLQQNPFGGGMQFGQNAPSAGLANQLANPGQQGGLMAMIMQNPQLLQWFMQQQQGAQGAFPQGGGGVTLAQLLGAPQQATGQSA